MTDFNRKEHKEGTKDTKNSVRQFYFDKTLGRVDISEPDSMKSDGYVNPTVSDIELKSNGYSKYQHSLMLSDNSPFCTPLSLFPRQTKKEKHIDYDKEIYIYRISRKGQSNFGKLF